MTRLPRGDQAALDIRKIEDYCLSSAHPRGRHKARVFREALDVGRGDDGMVARRPHRQPCVPLATAKPPSWLPVPGEANWRVDVTVERHGGSAVVRTIWIVQSGQNFPSFVTCWVLMMDAKKANKERERTVRFGRRGFLIDRPSLPRDLRGGRVGTVVEQLDDRALLVEFSDDQGRAYAVAPCPPARSCSFCTTYRRRLDRRVGAARQIHLTSIPELHIASWRVLRRGAPPAAANASGPVGDRGK